MLDGVDDGGCEVRVGLIDDAIEEIAREYPDVDDTTKSLVYGFFYLAGNFAKVGEAALNEFGLSWGEYVVLATLRRKGRRGSMSPKGLIESVGLSSGGISNILRRLEHRKLIRRAPSERDGRAIVVSITSAGVKLADRTIPAVSASEQAFFGEYSREKRKRLYGVLRELIEHTVRQNPALGTSHSDRQPLD